MKRRNILIAAGSAVALGGAAAAASGFGFSAGTPQRSTAPSKTADITKTTLVDFVEYGGQLGYGATTPLRYPGHGTITWLPPVGTMVNRGEPLFKVDNEAVVLMLGPLPLYRPLSVGVQGPDVSQLESNLLALGFGGFTADENFTASTESAVKRWQHALKVAETGVVAPGQVLVADGAVRVAQHELRVGDAAGGTVLQYTASARVVAVAVPADQQRYAPVGTAVTVTLPDSKTVAGRVESVAAVATQENGPPTVSAMVTVADQNALGTIQSGPVRVKFVSDQRKDVLTVPVAALVALLEGGYGIEVVEGSANRYVAVETGLFAGGRVEIRGAGLQAGMKVGVPK